MARRKLICKDCGTEIFVDVNMVMLKDSLWKNICDEHEDALCDKCMEERMGRPIVEKDFKKSDGEIPLCNEFWIWHNFGCAELWNQANK